MGSHRRAYMKHECPYCGKKICSNMMNWHMNNKCDKAAEGRMEAHKKLLKTCGIEGLRVHGLKEAQEVGRGDELIAYLKALPISELMNVGEASASGRLEELANYITKIGEKDRDPDPK